jgi:hypothetical protein
VIRNAAMYRFIYGTTPKTTVSAAIHSR